MDQVKFQKVTTFLKSNFPIIAIALISAFFRLYKIYDYAEFLGDQGRDVVIVADFLKNGNLFFIGPQTSIGNMYLGPYYYYLIAPALLIANFNPLGPAVLIAILGIVTTTVIYKISCEWFNQNTAVIASVAYAISPVAIKYSTFSWNPNIMPLFSLLFIYFIVTAVSEKKYRFLNLASLCFIMSINSHYLALLLIPPTAIYILYAFFTERKKKNILKPLILNLLTAALIFVISLTPQILFDIKHNGQNFNAIVKFFTVRETTVNLKAYKAIPNIIPLFNQINTRLLASKNEVFGIVISVIFAILLLIRSILSKKRKYILILAAWYIFGLIGLGLYKQHIYDHYFGFLFPVIFILFAALISSLKFLNIIIFVLIVTFSLLETPLRYSPNRQLQTAKDVTNLIIEQSSSKPFNLALIAKQNYDPPYRYFLKQQKAPLYTLQEKLTDQLFVICEPWQVECQPINHPFWDIAAFGWAKIDQQWQINDITIFRLVHTQ